MSRPTLNVVPLPAHRPHPRTAARCNLRGVKLAGTAIMLLFFGVAGGWAALAPLDSAAVAPGVIKVAGDRKLIQHLEGGIIADLKATNGLIVKTGDVLIRLDDTQAKAQLELIRNRIATREALAARLRAERDGKTEIAFDAALLANPSSVARDAVAVQRDVFVTGYRNLKDEQEILAQRRRQTEEEIAGLEKLIDHGGSTDRGNRGRDEGPRDAAQKGSYHPRAEPVAQTAAAGVRGRARDQHGVHCQGPQRHS